MKVFLSWSGGRSQHVAEALKSWLPDIIQAVDPWVSSQDVSKGSRALSHVASSLEGSNFGVICVTPENQESQWLNFEAGALSKQLEQAFVFPFLLDVGIADLTGPLSQFQATASDSREDVFKLVSDINQSLDSGGVPESRLLRTFDKNWDDLHKVLDVIRKDIPENKPKQRTTQDMFGELTVLIRKQDRRIAELVNRVRHDPMRNFGSQSVTGLESPPAIRIREAMDSFGFADNEYSLRSDLSGTNSIMLRRHLPKTLQSSLRSDLRKAIGVDVEIFFPLQSDT